MRLHREKQEDEYEYVASPEEDNSLAAALYREYAPKLFAYVSRKIAFADEAEDVLLEVFLALLEHERDVAALSADGQRAWLWTVARNKVNDYHRRHHRRPSVPLEHVEEMLDKAPTPEQVALQQEEYDHLRSSLRHLSSEQQEVLQLRFTGGLRCAEIAIVLHKREGAIRTMLSRTLNVLRDKYKHFQ